MENFVQKYNYIFNKKNFFIPLQKNITYGNSRKK